MTDVEELLRSLAGHGLHGALGPWPAAPLEPPVWAGLLVGVRRERLSGLLVDALADGALLATSEQQDQASQLHFEQVCGVLVLESAALPVLDAFAAAGVATKVLKGSAVAHLDYPDPAQRLFIDVDLLVRSEDVDAAVDVLLDLGHRRHSVQPRAGFDRRFGKGATFTSPEGVEVDLHRTFVMGPFGLRLDLDDLWAVDQHFTLAGRHVGALDDECRFLHACFHTALGDATPRLVPQRDVAQMLLHGSLDLERVDRLMRAWKAEPVVARAVRLTWDTLRLSDLTALSVWAQRYVTSPRAARDLAVYIDDDERSYAAKSVAALVAVPSVRDRVALALALAVPRRGFVPPAAGRPSRWRRALRELTVLARPTSRQ